MWCGREIDAAIHGYTPLVKSIARDVSRKLPSSFELDDLVQSGMIGLLEAAARFNDSQGTPFHGYAAVRIRGQILDDLRLSDWLPRTLRKAKRDIIAATDKTQNREGRAARHAEIAAELGISLTAYHLLAAEATTMENADDYDFPADGDLSDKLEAKRQAEALILGLAKLPLRHRQIMALYYDADLPLTEIAAQYGVTDTRVCQIKAEAIRMLRRGMGQTRSRRG